MAADNHRGVPNDPNEPNHFSASFLKPPYIGEITEKWFGSFGWFGAPIVVTLCSAAKIRREEDCSPALLPHYNTTMGCRHYEGR